MNYDVTKKEKEKKRKRGSIYTRSFLKKGHYNLSVNLRRY
jgi:hypothetical protein